MMKAIRATICCLIAILIAPAISTRVNAQTPVNWDQSSSNNYATGANWDSGFPPAATFLEYGVIGNNILANGTANVGTSIGSSPGGIILGNGVGRTGTLNVNNSGKLNVVSLDLTDGLVHVGKDGGRGVLSVAPGGMLTAKGLQLAGATTSSITLGGVAAGTAVLNTESTTLNRATRVIGANVQFETSGILTLGDESNLIAQITGPTHSPLKASNAVLGGKLSVELTGIPTVGQAWNLIDAAQIEGQFSSIDSSAVTLGAGQVFNVHTSPGGNKGILAQLVLDQVLVLTVNRSTRQVAISNPSSVNLSLDGYTIHSATGSLSGTGWNSLDDQNASGGDWRESNPTPPNRLSELKRAGSTSVTQSTPISIGAAFINSPTRIGQKVDDLEFEYYTQDGRTWQGLVQYSGQEIVNNLALRIDPATGAAQLRNESTFTVSIDGYTVGSVTSSLDRTNWHSLDEQNIAGGDWRESNSSNLRITELKQSAGLVLAPNATFNLGNLFKTSGQRDLVLEYLLNGESAFQAGAVFYTPASQGIAGDYNNNGTVDAADYTLWRNNVGTSNPLFNDPTGGVIGNSQYLTWKGNFGMSSSGLGGMTDASPVPEPTAWLILLGLIGFAGSRRIVPRTS